MYLDRQVGVGDLPDVFFRVEGYQLVIDVRADLKLLANHGNSEGCIDLCTASTNNRQNVFDMSA